MTLRAQLEKSGEAWAREGAVPKGTDAGDRRPPLEFVCFSRHVRVLWIRSGHWKLTFFDGRLVEAPFFHHATARTISDNTTGALGGAERAGQEVATDRRTKFRFEALSQAEDPDLHLVRFEVGESVERMMIHTTADISCHPSEDSLDDSNGNTLTDASGKSYPWDFENRLVQAVVQELGGGTFKLRNIRSLRQKNPRNLGRSGTTNSCGGSCRPRRAG